MRPFAQFDNAWASGPIINTYINLFVYWCTNKLAVQPNTNTKKCLQIISSCCSALSTIGCQTTFNTHSRPALWRGARIPTQRSFYSLKCAERWQSMMPLRNLSSTGIKSIPHNSLMNCVERFIFNSLWLRLFVPIKCRFDLSLNTK